MNVFTFSSKTIENVRIACGWEEWAVNEPLKEAVNKQRETRINLYVQVGDLGMFYLPNPIKCFTVPFLIETLPQDTNKVSAPWDGVWSFPFNIRCLGRPSQLLPIHKLRQRFTGRKISFASPGLFSFCPNKSLICPDIIDFVLSKIGGNIGIVERQRIIEKIACTKARIDRIAPKKKSVPMAQWWESL